MVVFMIGLTLYSRYLPRDLKTKQTKTILCVRNPKDTAVSFFNHMKGFKSYDYNGQWNNWIRPYILGKCKYDQFR